MQVASVGRSYPPLTLKQKKSLEKYNNTIKSHSKALNSAKKANFLIFALYIGVVAVVVNLNNNSNSSALIQNGGYGFLAFTLVATCYLVDDHNTKIQSSKQEVRENEIVLFRTFQ